MKYEIKPVEVRSNNQRLNLKKGKMIRGGAQSWNMRDLHMMELLKSLMNFLQRERAKPIKAVVWVSKPNLKY